LILNFKKICLTTNESSSSGHRQSYFLLLKRFFSEVKDSLPSASKDLTSGKTFGLPAPDATDRNDG